MTGYIFDKLIKLFPDQTKMLFTSFLLFIQSVCAAEILTPLISANLMNSRRHSDTISATNDASIVIVLLNHTESMHPSNDNVQQKIKIDIVDTIRFLYREVTRYKQEVGSNMKISNEILKYIKCKQPELKRCFNDKSSTAEIHDIRELACTIEEIANRLLDDNSFSVAERLHIKIVRSAGVLIYKAIDSIYSLLDVCKYSQEKYHNDGLIRIECHLNDNEYKQTVLMMRKLANNTLWLFRKKRGGVNGNYNCLTRIVAQRFHRSMAILGESE